MRYILVNERVPKRNRFCAFCCGAITTHYLRELSTRIKYCGLGCYAEHCYATLQALGGFDNETTVPMPVRKGLRPYLALPPPDAFLFKEV